MNNSISDFEFCPAFARCTPCIRSVATHYRWAQAHKRGYKRISDSESSSFFFNPQSAIRNSQSTGFTLLEVLLAMAILAMISTVIYGSFTNSARNIKQAEQSRDDTDMARALLGRLSNDIANAYTRNADVPVVFYGKKEELAGEAGKADEKIRHDNISMTTLTNWPKPDSKETELWEVEYFFKEKPEGKGYTLYRREKRELSSSVPALEGGTEYEITDRVESLQFKYLDGSNWTDNGWDRKTSAPRAVEIIVIFDTGRIYTTKVDVGNS